MSFWEGMFIAWSLFYLFIILYCKVTSTTRFVLNSGDRFLGEKKLEILNTYTILEYRVTGGDERELN